MTPEDHICAATDLLEAERTGEQISLLTLRYPEMGMDDAYGIQKSIRISSFIKGEKSLAGRSA